MNPDLRTELRSSILSILSEYRAFVSEGTDELVASSGCHNSNHYGVICYLSFVSRRRLDYELLVVTVKTDPDTTLVVDIVDRDSQPVAEGEIVLEEGSSVDIPMAELRDFLTEHHAAAHRELMAPPDDEQPDRDQR